MANDAASLYSAWTQAIPDAFRMLAPGWTSAAARAVTAEAADAAPPIPVDQIGHAFGVFEGVLTQLYQAYLPLLAEGGLTAQPFEALAQAATRAFSAAALPLPASSAASPFSAGWQALSTAALPGAAQLQLGMERTFGGLGEAFGLGPLRELDAAWRDMLAARAAKQQAQAEYLAVAAQAFAKGTASLLQELQAMGRRGERIDSLLAFMRLWIREVDAPLHDAMQSEPGLAVTAKVIRASTEHRQHVQKMVGIVSEALYLPTRADVNEAFREIQELKRELRRMKRALPAQTSAPAPAPALAPKKRPRRKERAS